MTRGSSLNQDLKFLVNNPRYSDVEIICKNQEKLYGCRAILAARSEVFDALLYNGMKESYENQISFPTINSSEMEITLEYIYTGVIKEEVFTKDNIIEAFEVADYFQLPDLQDFVLKVVRTTLEGDHPNELIPELLSKAIDTMVVTDDNVLLKLLAETLVSIPLNNIEFGRLSMPALRYFLSHSYLNELTLTVPEYEVFRHGAILAAMQVSADATKSLLRRLPAFEEIDDTMKNNDGFTYSRRVAETLDPLIEFIDFKRIKYQTLVNLIKPLKIIPAEIISDDPRSKKSKPSDLNEIRTFPFGIDCIWDELACGSNLLIEENGTVVQAQSGCNLHQSVRGKVELKGECTYEWDVIIDSHCFFAWVGVCASEGFNFGEYAGNQSAGWVLGSSGLCYHSGNWVNYCPPFVNDYLKKVTVHLDMKKRTCAFSVNGVKYPEVSGWDDLPSKLYPVVSLYSPGRFIIQPH